MFWAKHAKPSQKPKKLHHTQQGQQKNKLKQHSNNTKSPQPIKQLLKASKQSEHHAKHTNTIKNIPTAFKQLNKHEAIKHPKLVPFVENLFLLSPSEDSLAWVWLL